MIGSNLLAAGLVLAGLLCELRGLPAFHQTLAPPPLDLVLLLLAQSLRGGRLVFWAGLLGLCEDLIQRDLPGSGTFCFVTAGLVAAAFQGVQRDSPSRIDRLLHGILLLMVLWGLRTASGAGGWLSTSEVIDWRLALQRMAVTLLAFVIVNFVLALGAPLRRRQQLA
jgi:cell shape-determining protein MreD